MTINEVTEKLKRCHPGDSVMSEFMASRGPMVYVAFTNLEIAVDIKEVRELTDNELKKLIWTRLKDQIAAVLEQENNESTGS